jgi:hypothetical protein
VHEFHRTPVQRLRDGEPLRCVAARHPGAAQPLDLGIIRPAEPGIGAIGVSFGYLKKMKHSI